MEASCRHACIEIIDSLETLETLEILEILQISLSSGLSCLTIFRQLPSLGSALFALPPCCCLPYVQARARWYAHFVQRRSRFVSDAIKLGRTDVTRHDNENGQVSEPRGKYKISKGLSGVEGIALVPSWLLLTVAFRGKRQRSVVKRESGKIESHYYCWAANPSEASSRLTFQAETSNCVRSSSLAKVSECIKLLSIYCLSSSGLHMPYTCPKHARPFPHLIAPLIPYLLFRLHPVWMSISKAISCHPYSPKEANPACFTFFLVHLTLSHTSCLDPLLSGTTSSS